MVASLKCVPRWMVGNEERYKPSPAGDVRSRAEPLEHRGPILPLREFLRAPARPQSQVPHLRENARHLHPIQLRDEWQQFRDKLIFYQVADFFLAIAFAA